MNDESLEELLQAAGRSAAPPLDLLPGLADRVRRLQCRRKHVRKVAAAWVVVILLGAGSTFFYATGLLPSPDASVAEHPEPPRDTQDLSAEQIERLRVEIARLGAEAERTRQTVNRRIRQQRLREQLAGLQQDLVGLDPLELAQIEIEKTAFLLVDFAEQRTTGGQDDFPADAYRQVLELFPNTKGARIARKRLDQSFIEKGDL